MINVIRAVYASANRGADVTAAVKQMIASGNDDIAVNNDALGGDPDPGSVKFFFVWYTAPPVNNGNPIALACQEGGNIDLVPAQPAPGRYSTAPQQPLAASAITPITVKQAVYGTPNNGFDVTAICQAIVNQGGVGVDAFNIPISNGTFGGDPDYGAGKSFAIQYSFGSSGPIYAGGGEGQTLALPSA